MRSWLRWFYVAWLVGCKGNADATPDAIAAADAAVETASDATPSDDSALPLPALATCVTGPAFCTDLPVEDTIAASYRKDAYLPKATYAEYTDTPLTGGRFHVAAVAHASGTVTKVVINGVDVAALEQLHPGVEWHHVWPRAFVAGEAVWLAFHSRDPAWDIATTGHIRVETTAGVAIDGDFPVQATPVPLTYVTTDAARETVLIHVHNTDTQPHTMARIVLNGRDVTAGAPCVGESQIAPGQSALWTVRLCAPWQPGAAWTARVDYADAPSAIGVGRVVPPRFAIEAWPNNIDCVSPAAPASGPFKKHFAAGFDTGYWYWGEHGCNFSFADMANDPTGVSAGWQTLVGDDFPADQPDLLHPDAAIAGFLTGDESDAQLWDPKTGENQYAAKAATTELLWKNYPQWPVYNGGMTNGNMGAFAGVTDIQGIDFYIAACAPHVTPFGNAPPVRGAYDYLHNARNNHMPLPTWQYAQGLAGGWNKGGGGQPVIHSQPSVAEIWSQGIAVMAAGAKGLMWFQTNMPEAEFAPELWQAIADVNWTFRGVRALLREGDLTGQATSTHALVLVDAIRARRAIVVPALDFATDNIVDDVLCLSSFINDNKAPHWLFSSVTTDIAVTVPRDLAVVDVFEVLADRVVDVPVRVDAATRTVTLPGVALGEARAARVFVLAGDWQVRSEVEQALHQ